jgi:ABC-type nitrate/sulfonate/bicarbonate transport system substrate-binding protein
MAQARSPRSFVRRKGPSEVLRIRAECTITFSNGIIEWIPRATLLKLAITVPALALPAPAQGQTRPLLVGGSPSETYAEPYYGLDGGIFARDGLDARVAAFPNGASIAQAIIAGSIDVGLTDRIQVANATIRNIPIL